MWTPQLMLWMTLAGSVGCLVGLLVVAALARTGHVIQNYRGRRVVYPSGVIVPLALSAGLAPALGLPHALQQDPISFAGAVWGFSLLGLFDDFFGDRGAQGFRGHLDELRRGHVTTGLMKAAGGLAIGLWIGLRVTVTPARAILAALVVALAANFFNLLDVRPGRALKVFSAVALGMVAFSASAAAWTMWPAIVPAFALLVVLDLREYAMLGDTGSNALGAMIGLTFVVNFSWQVQLAAAILLAAATIASEKYSFSATIEAAPVLRWLDALGRRSD